MKRVFAVVALTFLLALPSGATKLNGHPTLTFDDLWYAGIEWDLTAQYRPFPTTMTFTHPVKTNKVQMTYHCLRCEKVWIEVTTPDGKPLIPRLYLQGNVNSQAVELDVPETEVSSLEFIVMSSGKGNVEIQMTGLYIPQPLTKK